MPVPIDPYDFANGTIADADQVDARFKRIFDCLNPAIVGLDRDNVKGGLLKLFESAVADRQVQFGSTSAAWAASRQTVSCSHGLGVVPLIVVAWADYIPAANSGTGFDEAVACSYGGGTTGGFNVRVQALNVGGAPGGSLLLHWLAVA